jgi:hypothetical protein
VDLLHGAPQGIVDRIMSIVGLRTSGAGLLVLASAVVSCGSEFKAGDHIDGGSGTAGSAGTNTSGSGGQGGSSTGNSGSTGMGGEASGGTGGSCVSSMNSCGPSCQICTVSSDREVPTCDGMSCGTACRNGDPRCTDDKCSRLLWNFDSGSLDGITARESPGLTVRSFNGNMALGVDISQLTEISFTLPICLSGTVDLRSKTFSFRVFFSGTDSGGPQYYMQSSVPAPQNGAYLDTINVASGVWTPYSSPLSKSSFSGTTTSITIQAGTLGAVFVGTIWFDDFKVQ